MISGAVGISYMIFGTKVNSATRVVSIAPEPLQTVVETTEENKDKEERPASPTIISSSRSLLASASTNVTTVKSIHVPQSEYRINIPSIEEVMSENDEEKEGEKDLKVFDLEEGMDTIETNRVSSRWELQDERKEEVIRPTLITIESRKYFF